MGLPASPPVVGLGVPGSSVAPQVVGLGAAIRGPSVALNSSTLKTQRPLRPMLEVVLMSSTAGVREPGMEKKWTDAELLEWA